MTSESIPHIKRHQSHANVCPCSGKDEGCHKALNEDVVAHSEPLEALLALYAASWLDDDPSDTDELASAKRQGREAIDRAAKPN